MACQCFQTLCPSIKNIFNSLHILFRFSFSWISEQETTSFETPICHPLRLRSGDIFQRAFSGPSVCSGYIDTYLHHSQSIQLPAFLWTDFPLCSVSFRMGEKKLCSYPVYLAQNRGSKRSIKGSPQKLVVQLPLLCWKDSVSASTPSHQPPDHAEDGQWYGIQTLGNNGGPVLGSLMLSPASHPLRYWTTDRTDESTWEASLFSKKKLPWVQHSETCTT